jgi:hypothetical protein
MRKTSFALLGALLIAGSTAQAMAAVHHGKTRESRTALHQANSPSLQTLDERNVESLGSSVRDRTLPGGEDTTLNPPAN